MTDTAPTHDHLRREALTMGLYVSITLLAALSVAVDESTHDIDVLAVVWGTTVGLAVAHWFAFSLAVRLVAHVHEHEGLRQQLTAQIGAAMAVAAVATVPVLLLPDDLERAGARFATAGCIGVLSFAQARAYGEPRGRALKIAAGALLVGLVVAGVKQALTH
jgi:hypothetical protein